MVHTPAMSDAILSDAEREALLTARVRLLKLPPDRIVPAQTAPVAPLKNLFDALDGDNATVHAAVLAFIKAVNELCDSVSRKNGKANVSAVEAAQHGFEALFDRFELNNTDPAAALRTIRNTRAAARGLDVAAIGATVFARSEARAAKDFETADRLHKELVAQGVVIVDDADNSDWTLSIEN